jgi:hypothetical protein
MVQTPAQYEFVYHVLVAYLNAAKAKKDAGSAADEEMPLYGNVSQPARRAAKTAPAPVSTLPPPLSLSLLL